MNALMLIFLLSVNGQAATVAVAFPTMAVCEAKKGEAMAKMAEVPDVEYVAVACVKPAKVQAL